MRLEASELIVTRGTRRIVDRATFTLEGGAIACIEGPSGSGKTTLLRAIATLVAIDGGTILLDGVSADAISPRTFRTRIAYVPQLPPMLEGTVADNVAKGPELRGEKLASAAIEDLLIQAGLPLDLAGRPARELSGGERQRVAFARALANRPAALLLDEPTASLDPAAAEHIVAHVKELASRGLGVLVVTHQAEHARALGGARYRCVDGRLTREDA
jgi:ABC-type multidrug transport system ATPase subunit